LYYYLAQKVNRPIGVTIIAILTIIIGIIAIFGGISLVVFGAFLSVTPIGLTNNYSGATTTEDSSSQLIVQVFGVVAAIAGAILLAIGTGYIVMSYGLIKSKRRGHGP
jgi:drug/metabolite transporter (DMT)-like permease